jgi:RNA polymerase sigma-70 factor (ECF subfamily)
MNELAARWPAEQLLSEEDLERTFEARLNESSTLAVRVAYSVVRNQADAEDVAQEAFIRAYRRRSTLRDPQRFRSWLVRITWRLALDWKRSQRRREARETREGRPSTVCADAEVRLVDGERQARLWKAIDALPDKLRIVTVLAAIEGHGVRDVAMLLRIPDGTVKSRLSEARRRLQEQLR